MKMMTQELAKKLPKIGATAEDENPQIIIHYFNPCGMGDWYVYEGEKQENGDWLFFGYVKSPLDPMFDEHGTFTLSQLQSIKLPFGLTIERDKWWVEKGVKEVID